MQLNRTPFAARFRRRVVIALILALTGSLMTPVFADDRVYLDLTVNGVTHEPVLAVLRGEDVLLARTDLTSAAVPAADVQGEPAFGQEFISLAALRDRLTFHFDRHALQLSIELGASSLKKVSRDIAPSAPVDLTAVSARGLLFNYGLHEDAASGWSGSLDARANVARSAVFDMTAVRSTTGSLNRGLANFTFDAPVHLRRTTIGDTIAGGADLGGGALLGGISVKRQFDENPYVITYPLPSLQATVLQPSRADIYVNGALVKSIELAPGTYDLNNLPIRAGIAHAQVVLRSATGAETLLDTVLYGSTGLLRKGLTDYAYAAGFVRRGIESPQDSYGPAAVSGRYRVGLTDASTAGAHFEATPQLRDGGIEYDGALPFGDVHAAVALSRSGMLSGNAATMAYVSAGHSSGFAVLARLQSVAYSTLGLRAADDRALLQVAAQATLPLAARITASVGLQVSRYRDSGNVQQLTVSAQRRLGDFNVVASYAGSRRTASGFGLANSFQVSVGRRAGKAGYVSSTARGGSDPGTTLSLEHTANTPLDTQFALEASSNRSSPVRGSVQTGLPFAVVSMSASAGSAEQPLSAAFNLSGSVVHAGHATLFGQPVSDAYAVVEAPGIAGAKVFLNNQFVARTNRAGYALVPGLASYQSNAIGISDAGLSLDETVGGTDQNVAPEYKGAGIVRYTAHREHGVIGRALAPYGQIDVRLPGTATQSSPIDADGRFYFEHLEPGTYDAQIVDAHGARCKATFIVPAFSGLQFSVGAVACAA